MKAALLAATLTAVSMTAVLGQSSTHPMNVPGRTSISPSVLMNYPLPIPEGWKETKQITTVPINRPEAVVIRFGNGGLISEHQRRYADYRLIGAPVELRGPCYSACTVVLTYIDRQNLCIAEGAFMAFHAARTSLDGPIHGGATLAMYDAYPPDIRAWIDRNGGVGKLPRDGYWTMYDRELWAMGYPKCTP